MTTVGFQRVVRNRVPPLLLARFRLCNLQRFDIGDPAAAALQEVLLRARIQREPRDVQECMALRSFARLPIGEQLRLLDFGRLW